MNNNTILSSLGAFFISISSDKHLMNSNIGKEGFEVVYKPHGKIPSSAQLNKWVQPALRLFSIVKSMKKR